MYAIIRRYRTPDAKEVARRVERGFLPQISNAPGFVGYYVIDEGSGHQLSISLFENFDSAEHSNRLAAQWVRDHGEYLPEPPEVFSGEVLLERHT